jgi:hypothetical protein
LCVIAKFETSSTSIPSPASSPRVPRRQQKSAIRFAKTSSQHQPTTRNCPRPDGKGHSPLINNRSGAESCFAFAITDHGVICTGGSKLAEHGGFSNDDPNVALVLSSPRIRHGKVVEDTTFTTQIAPTIL